MGERSQRCFHNRRRWCSLARVYSTTSPRHDPTRGLTRRTTLAALGAGTFALALAGCQKGSSPQALPSAATIGKDALGPIYTETMTLITTYDTAIANNPLLIGLLGPLRDDHRQHAIALAALMGIAAPTVSLGANPSGTPMPPMPSASAPPSGVPSGPTSGRPSTPPPSPAPAAGPQTAPARALLSAAEKTAQANVTAACISAPADRVAVLASITASRATHVAALR